MRHALDCGEVAMHENGHQIEIEPERKFDYTHLV
jgi:hypothetical protein